MTDATTALPAPDRHPDAGLELTRLLSVMQALRDPATGCPWDQVQDFDSIVPYTIEEAYEAADAIARRDWTQIPDELGDLLFQIVYYADMAADQGRFDFATIARGIADKMIRRHPHVFAGASAEDIRRRWEDGKAGERNRRRETGALAGIPANLPALTRAAKLCSRAARVGFDWQDPALVIDKIGEELAELRAELAVADRSRLRDELGDVLFTIANLARALELDPEDCLRHGNAKFQRRFEAMERAIEASGRGLAETSAEEKEAAWQAVKRGEATARSGAMPT